MIRRMIGLLKKRANSFYMNPYPFDSIESSFYDDGYSDGISDKRDKTDFGYRSSSLLGEGDRKAYVLGYRHAGGVLSDV